MVIKTINKSQKNLKFDFLVNYVNKLNNQKSDYSHLRFYHNLESIDAPDIAMELEENLRYKPKRKNGVGCYHEVLTFSEKDSKNGKLNPDVVEDLVSKFIHARAKNACVYGRVHDDTDNLHVHLIVSSNNFMSTKSNRLSKSDFLRIREELEKYQQEHYPFLDSIVYAKELKKELKQVKEKEKVRYREEANKRKQNLYQLKERLKQEQPTPKKTQKQEMEEIVLNAAEKSKSFDDFYSNLEKNEGIQVYKRGDKVTGVQKKGSRKYRFSTLVKNFSPDEISLYQIRIKVFERMEQIKGVGISTPSSSKSIEDEKTKRLRQLNELQNKELDQDDEFDLSM